MVTTADALDRVADDALAELRAARPSNDAVGAAIAAAALCRAEWPTSFRRGIR